MVGATGYGPGSLAAQSVRGLSVERGRSARLGLDLTRTQVPIVQLYEAGASVSPARQGSGGWCWESETVFYPVITMRHHQIVIVTGFSAYSAEGLFEWDLLLDLWWWK